MEQTLVISHRTNMGEYPENSRRGLEAALASGVDGVEVDVRATRDGHLVLQHDRSFSRTHSVAVNVDELTYAETQRLTPGGEPVSLLSDALALCAGRALLVVDVKQQGVALALRRLLTVARTTETWVWTHDPTIARELVDVLDGSVPVSLIVRPDLAGLWGRAEAMRLARNGGLAGLLFEHPDVDSALVERASTAGLALHCGRTNEAADIARVLALPLTSVSSDFPGRLRRPTEEHVAGPALAPRPAPSTLAVG